MTINGSTNNNQWTYKLEVSEIGTSIQNKTSTVQVKTYLGRASSQSYLGGNYSNSVSITGASSQTKSGNIPYPTYINGGAWLLLQTFTFTVPNTGTPTTVTISSSMSSSDFTPSSCSASGTMQLTILHLPPVLNNATVTEKNTAMTSLGIPNTTVVRFLSKKEFKLYATPNDGATITKYKLYGFRYSGVEQASNTFTVDFRNEAKYTVKDNGVVQLTQKVTDSMGSSTEGSITVLINNVSSPLNTILYNVPTLEETSTTIKRKSGSGTNLTDNKATLNLVGTIYKNNTDVIGQHNSITKVGYKLWQRGTSEPANYTNLTVSISSSGAVTLSNYEISNVDFTKAYNYKIILQDNYQDHTNTYYSYIVSGTIPLGKPTWSEYKDHVDFMAITVEGNPVVESGTGYIKYYDGTMICYGSSGTGVLSWSQDSIIWYARALTLPDFAQTFISAPIVTKTIQSMSPVDRHVWISGTTAPSTTNPGNYNLATYWNATSTSVTITYIAIGRWK